tara:strand:- start:832 stop:1494 length:663 start_codon:yes stop_codon:yes gene_type:complete
MNYSALVSAVSSYTENTFPTVDMNVFITQAEKRIYNAVQIPALRKNVTGITTASNKYLACPDDFLSSYSLAAISPTTGAYSYLLNKDVNFIREAYPTPTSTGSPKYYALFGPAVASSVITTELTFLLGPTPNAAYSMELHYYYYPETIVTATNTWLSDNYDPVLLYGTLVEAYTYMKGEQDMITLYNTKFAEALTQLKRLGDGLERQDSYRSGQARMPVT